MGVIVGPMGGMSDGNLKKSRVMAEGSERWNKDRGGAVEGSIGGRVPKKKNTRETMKMVGMMKMACRQ